MMKDPMENQFNSHQPIHSNIKPSETEITCEPTPSSSRTTDHSKSPLNTAHNAIMGKCLSVCKERKNPFLGDNESPADAPSPSPDRNDPPKILRNTSRTLTHIKKTNNVIDGMHALTDDAKHVGHFGLTFISLSPIDHQKKGQGEQTSKLEANKPRESDYGENEQQRNAPPAVSDSEPVDCELEENVSDRHQQIRDPTPGDAVNNTPHASHSGEEGISSQNAAHNHRSSSANLQNGGSQEDHGNYQSSPGAHPDPLDENDNTQGLQNEEEDTNEAAMLLPAGNRETQRESEVSSNGETHRESEASSQWITLRSRLQRNEMFPSGEVPEPVEESNTECQSLRRLLEFSRPHSHSICVAPRAPNVTEVDVLFPGVLDGPPMILTIPSKPQHQDSYRGLSLPAIQVLRLPRLQSCKSFDLDSFLYNLAQKSSGLKELAFEDSGQISQRTANNLADNKCLKKLEVCDPKIPLLRALTIGCSELEELCLYGLTTKVEKDLCLYIHQKGASLKSLSLNFSLSARQAEWTTGQKQFFRRMLTFLDIAIADDLQELQVLEVSSCPSYEVKHSFDATESTSTSGTEPLALFRVDAMIRKRQRTLHPKASIIALTKIKLRGHFTAITDSLGVLSWVNQDKMEIEVELPGVSAIYPRGYGLMKPVVLTFLQLDEFISKGLRSPWLELTALREIDFGEIEFVQMYTTGTASIRAETRRLLVTSRESLSRVRACYKIPTRDICVETRKLLGQIVPLTPMVNHLDICRDIVLHASVEDYEYMQTIMLLRRWNLKTVQLVRSQNYRKVETANASPESEKNGTEEFIRKLPTFLMILAGACPKLENLVAESEEMCIGWTDWHERTRLLGDAMKALEVFERVVPTAKVGTLQGQLHAWESAFATDES